MPDLDPSAKKAFNITLCLAVFSDPSLSGVRGLL